LNEAKDRESASCAICNSLDSLFVSVSSRCKLAASPLELLNRACKSPICLSERESSSLCSRKLFSKLSIVSVRSLKPLLKLSIALSCSSKSDFKESSSLGESFSSRAVSVCILARAQKSSAFKKNKHEERNAEPNRDDPSALWHLIATFLREGCCINSIGIPSDRKQKILPPWRDARKLDHPLRRFYSRDEMTHPMGSLVHRLRRSRLLKRFPIPEEAWRKALGDHPILAGLTDAEVVRLRAFAAVFLHEKQFEPPPGIELPEQTRLSIAVQATLPVLSLGYDWIGGWSSVIVHPDEFVQRRRDLDSAGVVHEWDDPITGEAHPFGPIILSIADVEASGWGDGYNVVIHEIAHKLEMREGGSANGCPPLHHGMDRDLWQADFTEAFDDFRGRRRRRGTGRRSRIDRYAAENPSEFFAVLSEYFFEQPSTILREYPKVYRQLAAFYRQDPAERLPARR